MKMKGNTLADANKLLELVRPAVRRTAMAVQAGVMMSSPVKSGDLRRSWNTSEAETDGRRVVSRVGSNKVYARFQNTRTRNRGYVKQGIDATKEQAKQVLADGIREILPQMWEGRR